MAIEIYANIAKRTPNSLGCHIPMADAQFHRLVGSSTLRVSRFMCIVLSDHCSCS